ncbi:unnamed protein product [Pleuronectes platessa]|uniref:Uncharacterized protein n=1 Tax=Pleuronectes platessa TaxID=8262 RepID=A0A9N7VUW0_PLEPL|nr:unnamed protein product [Pleuronectes platessa]
MLIIVGHPRLWSRMRPFSPSAVAVHEPSGPGSRGSDPAPSLGETHSKTPDDAKTQREFMAHGASLSSFSFLFLIPITIEIRARCGRTMDYDVWTEHHRSQWWIQYGGFYIVRAHRSVPWWELPACQAMDDWTWISQIFRPVAPGCPLVELKGERTGPGSRGSDTAHSLGERHSEL